ncbi:MAG: hypothetical protein ACRDP1_14310 [Nocardioidaceae bacterium]
MGESDYPEHVPGLVDFVPDVEASDAALPPRLGFYDTDQELRYSLSWMACDWIAQTYGTKRLVALYRAMHKRPSSADPDTGEGAVIEHVLGISSRTLAERAAQHLIQVAWRGSL